MRKQYRRELLSPRPDERNDQATFMEAVSLGRKLSATIADLAQKLAQAPSLIEHPEFPKVGYKFFTDHFNPLKLWLFATDKNIAYLSLYVRMRNLDGLVYFIKTNCQNEFAIDTRQDPKDRQFSPEAHEFINSLETVALLLERES